MARIDDLLRAGFVWRGDRTDPDYRADLTGWWRDPETLGLLGPALAALNVSGEQPTVGFSLRSPGVRSSAPWLLITWGSGWSNSARTLVLRLTATLGA